MEDHGGPRVVAAAAAGESPATPPSVKRLRDAARGVSHQMPERPTPKNVDAQLDELRRGLRVVKHGRKGKPRDTWLFLDSHDGCVG